MSVASLSASFASVSLAPAQVPAPKPTPAQVRAQWHEKIVEDSAKLIVKDLDDIFGKEMDSLVAMHQRDKKLPEGTVSYSLRIPKSPDDVVPANLLRPAKMLKENTSPTLNSDIEKLTKPQVELYNEVLARSILKIERILDNMVLSLNLYRCEPSISPEIDGIDTFDYNKSTILKSKVVAVVLKAPAKVLQFFG